jgi:hypothetical protein
VWDRLFRKHQGLLLYLLNAPVIRLWFRWILRIHGDRSSVGNRDIIGILPNAIWWEDGGKCVAEFRTHQKYSKRLIHSFPFRQVFSFFHFWDWLVADRLIPSLSFGFSEYTGYPDEDPESTTSDGCVGEVYAVYSGITWTSMQGGSGNWTDDGASAEEVYVRIECDADNDGWFRILCRSGFLFDTSEIGVGSTISSAVFSLYGTSGKTFEQGTWGDSDIAMNVYSSSPASNTAWVAGDYGSFGTTAYCDTSIAYSSWATAAFNNFTLNSTGRSAVTLDGITKLGIRDATFDVPNSAPTWVTVAGLACGGYYADQAGTANDPKLVVTYTPASTAWTSAARIIFIARSDGT